jgi:AI-2 transport protein TqsA
VPTIGAIAALALPATMALAQSGSPGYALAVAALVLAVQTVAFNLVEPKVLGNRLGLSPLVILLALLLWGYVWGAVGMLMSVPLTAVLRIVLASSRSENLRLVAELLGP